MRGLVAVTLVMCALGAGQPAHPLPWPYEPGTASYAIGNNFGAYQRYNADPAYYHDGIDILAGAPRPAYSVSSGTVVYVRDDNDLYSGIVIGEPREGGTAYLYWHVRRDTIPFKLGARVNANDYIGDVVDWPMDNFDHIHFSKVRGEGGRIWTTWNAIGDPLADLLPISDTTAPQIESLDGMSPFLFSRNGTNDYMAATALKGSVDIVVKVSDLMDGSPWRLAPRTLQWSVAPVGGGTSLAGGSLVLDGALGEAGGVVETLYRSDSKVESFGDYDRREFVFVVTHGDMRRPVVVAHSQAAWNTGTLLNGDYAITVIATDSRGNSTTSTKNVTVLNP